MSNYIHIHACLSLCFLLCPGSNGIVRFYQERNLKYLMQETLPEEKCTSLFLHARSESSSLQTDECIYVFASDSCTNGDQSSYSIKLEPGTYPNLETVKQSGGSVNFYKKIRSIRKCEKDLNLQRGHVTFFDEYNKILADYGNVCGRVELPEFAQYPNSFDNHGMCVQIEVIENNIKQTVTEYGGRGPFSIASQPSSSITHRNKFLSIEPCTVNERACADIKAKVTKFSLSMPKYQQFVQNPMLSLGATTTFINNGSATVTQEYTATKSITQSTEVSLVKSTSKMSSWSVSNTVEFDVGWKVAEIVDLSFKESFTASYSRESSASESSGTVDRYENTTVFSVDQKIEIQSCTHYTVQSFVKMATGLQLKYTLTFEITGTFQGDRLNATELRRRLAGLKFIEDKPDGYTVVAEDDGTMLVDFGVDVIISGEGEKMPAANCPSHSQVIPLLDQDSSGLRVQDYQNQQIISICLFCIFFYHIRL